ncbi:MAG: hypothetical protein A2729_02590 [Candidatus Buchananbacteria bacterium RIFCSPHIGHO2_01_FULL_39_14]|uniref:HTH HARE-type domain-containing protein n=1 Tax=Candidatus Buchananbacteria bacterium RIFCSPHIGHO2_01_FULL_39_14 TaxID=1797532 RepID=A0A1G1XS87_9BACT|nr:MAG: hypothetical protein A2729_02590 [Candidatus Buchananbacteria bacterium RIFCSPHIGHO2_01_FULL_39_14]OGY48896.1 MAG: hypothetical protein A3D39_01240 [Candidatus Buchananbacteria bacterium RIFCSPHIGHO2_02_FULL_39_17]
MNKQNSILDKIIESQEKQQAASFNPGELVSILLRSLSNKEGDILARRFGLLGKEKETLEQIGKHYEITRERIRQIENATIKKIHELKEFKQQVENVEQYITRLLENYGGIMEENFLLNEINLTEPNESNLQSSRFILNHLLNKKIDPIKSDSDFLSGWRLPIISIDSAREAVKVLAQIIAEQQKLLKIEDLLSHFLNSDYYQKNKDQIVAAKLGIKEENLEQEIRKLIHSYLKISKNIEQNILGEWGLASWQTVVPKRMSDKIYLVLRKINKPLHFKEITDLINQSKFDKKIAYPPTIHNELILDNRFVLVGRGIYALKEWGYQPGTVLDVIIEILAKAGKPLTKEEVVQAVLNQRLVRKSTIYLALTNKEKIKKLPDGNYILNQS